MPVLDGGIGIDTFDDGAMRNAVWRTHLVTPGPAMPRVQPPARPRPHPGRQARPVRRPQYIRGAAISTQPRRQNVAVLAASVSASLLAQFTSLTVAPAGMGSPGPLRYALSTHTLEHLDIPLKPNCPFETQTQRATTASP